jgi:hypothetical protein
MATSIQYYKTMVQIERYYNATKLLQFLHLLVSAFTFFFRNWIIKSGLYIRRCTQPIITELQGTVHKMVKKSSNRQQSPD